MRYLAVLTLVFLFTCAEKAEEVISLPFYISEDLTPTWIAEDSMAYDEIHRIEDFQFIDQTNQKFGSEQLKGKVYIANFFFTTCPGICKTMTKELRIVQDSFQLSKAIEMVSFSVMPWVDSVEQLQYFQEMNDIDGSMWHLLTGEKTDIYSVARASFFADEGFGKSVTRSSDFLHTENVMLIDRKGRIRGVYSGTSRLDITRLIEDAKLLLLES